MIRRIVADARIARHVAQANTPALKCRSKIALPQHGELETIPRCTSRVTACTTRQFIDDIVETNAPKSAHVAPLLAVTSARLLGASWRRRRPDARRSPQSLLLARDRGEQGERSRIAATSTASIVVCGKAPRPATVTMTRARLRCDGVLSSDAMRWPGANPEGCTGTWLAAGSEDARIASHCLRDGRFDPPAVAGAARHYRAGDVPNSASRSATAPARASAILGRLSGHRRRNVGGTPREAAPQRLDIRTALRGHSASRLPGTLVCALLSSRRQFGQQRIRRCIERIFLHHLADDHHRVRAKDVHDGRRAEFPEVIGADDRVVVLRQDVVQPRSYSTRSRKPRRYRAQSSWRRAGSSEFLSGLPRARLMTPASR